MDKRIDEQRQTENGKQKTDKHYKFNIQTTRLLEMDQIKKEDIQGYLEACGYTPSHTTAKIAYFCAPWREEKDPSLAVYYKKTPQDWYDYGENIGGSIIDLAMKLYGDYAEGMRSLRRYSMGKKE
jgi:hypothetical protein